MNASISINSVLVHFSPLPIQIERFESVDQFIGAWRDVITCEAARKEKDIVYLWRTEKPIRRLKGESDIIYIGKTDGSLTGRYGKHLKIEATGKRNEPRYKHILEVYGSISFYLASSSLFGETARKAETMLLKSYFNDHLEYPPINMGR